MPARAGAERQSIYFQANVCSAVAGLSMILTRNLVVALIATVIAFSTLYIPQPMLPLLAKQFAVSPGEAGLLMTLAMLPLIYAVRR